MSRISVYKGGSSLLLKYYIDIDLVYFYPTWYEARQEEALHQQSENIDVHFMKARKPAVVLWCYLYHFLELIEGEDLHLSEFSIFENKQKYVECLLNYITLPLNHKYWYHILTAVSMFQNNSYELTETQLANIQKAHDNGITKEVYQDIVNYLYKQL